MPTTARFALSLDGFAADPDGRPALAAARGRGHGDEVVDGPPLLREPIDFAGVERVELLLVPVLFGGGVPFAVPDAIGRELRLMRTDTYPDGVVRLTYEFK